MSGEETAMSRTFAALQRLLPQHALSRVTGRAAAAQTPWLKRLLIERFAHAYRVNMTDAARELLDDYSSFNDFFTRELKPGARPLAVDPLAALSPADGTISQAGTISAGQLLQAKGHRYSLAALAGPVAGNFEGGRFVTVYLAPNDYHRVHLPLAGTLRETRAIPGALFSVNYTTERSIHGHFARYERLVCSFETNSGAMLVVLVGALIVASIETVWPGPPSPYRNETVARHELAYPRGAEIGRFLLGSTVIVCFEKNRAHLLDGIHSGTRIRMGEAIARLEPGPQA